MYINVVVIIFIDLNFQYLFNKIKLKIGINKLVYLPSNKKVLIIIFYMGNGLVFDR